MSERDRFLTEKVLGECWHDYDRELVSWGFATSSARFKDICKKCKSERSNINFSTPEGFFKLWNFCKKQSWWEDFLIAYMVGQGINMYTAIMAMTRELLTLINPDTFADAIAKYRGWEGE